jgi:hypothetical protein
MKDLTIYNEMKATVNTMDTLTLITGNAACLDLFKKVRDGVQYRTDAAAWRLLSTYGTDYRGLELFMVDCVTSCTLTQESRRTFKTSLQRLVKVVTDGTKTLTIDEKDGLKVELVDVVEKDAAADLILEAADLILEAAGQAAEFDHYDFGGLTPIYQAELIEKAVKHIAAAAFRAAAFKAAIKVDEAEQAAAAAAIRVDEAEQAAADKAAADKAASIAVAGMLAAVSGGVSLKAADKAADKAAAKAAIKTGRGLTVKAAGKNR